MHRKAFLVVSILVILCAGSAQAIDFSKGILTDIPPDRIPSHFGRLPASQMTSDDSAAVAAYRFAADTVKVLAVLVEWNNRPATYPAAVIDSLIFSRDVWPGGSVADYFHEVSYGQLVVAGDVVGWHNAGTYYGAGFNFESVLPAIDPIVDFSQYDGNGDGDVDAVIFVRSGTGQEDTHDPEDIWSYAYSYAPGGGPGPFDGMKVPRWNTSPELFPLRDSLIPTLFSGVKTLNKIRVFCHELTHSVGLPDVYDYDDKLVTSTYYTPNDGNDHPFVDWCLMGYAGYGLLSIRCVPPSHLCGWGKKELGWLTPLQIPMAVQDDLVIYDIETHADSSLYMIPINLAEGEYFLLEYRNPENSGLFDKLDSDFSVYFWPAMTYGGDPLERGLLISHVHDSLGAYYWRINAGLPNYPHYTVAVEDAGYNPGMPYTMNPGGNVSDSAQWWYPYETRKAAPFTSEVPGKETFGPSTVPSSDGYFGPSGVTVTVDSIVDDRLYASIIQADGDGDGWADGSDNCPDSANADQADADLDGVGDVCDNCPTVPVNNQLDYDADGVGDICDNCLTDSNPLQENSDDDYLGDACDNCPQLSNDDQANVDGDPFGDLCDLCPTVATTDNVPVMTGDVNVDAMLTSGDIVSLVNYVFKSGLPPQPAERVGDVNCDGIVNSTDIIAMVNHVFKSGAAPCDACAMAP